MLMPRLGVFRAGQTCRVGFFLVIPLNKHLYTAFQTFQVGSFPSLASPTFFAALTRMQYRYYFINNEDGRGISRTNLSTSQHARRYPWS